ncbi:MAG TPA: hypothetical protein VFT22_37880 [Kofleriaceae bacterium]|nr:hypothetical protein [Kofleriaceae bacterium]
MDLLLAHGDDGSPVSDREADPSTAAAHADRAPVREAKFLADITADASDLERQRWALVVPEGAAGERLAAAVRELVRARAEEQQADVLTIAAPPVTTAEQAAAWKRDVYPSWFAADEARRPRYLLILGDLDQVSFEIQQALAQDGLPGRLACASEDGYAAYAAKVLAWRREPSEHARARALFYTVHDGTRATTAGHAKLIQPCHARCALTARDRPGAFPASEVVVHGAPAPDPGELLELASPRHPTALLSMSHGLGPPRRRPWSPAEAREHQGAMSFGAEGALAGRDVAGAPFLPGGVWIYFACFGAGTPHASAYQHWLDFLAEHGMPALAPVSAGLKRSGDGGGFVSGLAKAALANPDGPLALLGHVDLAWSYAYEELQVDDRKRVTGSNRSHNFAQLMTKLVAGERVGAATLTLTQPLGAVSAALNTHYDRCKRAGTVEGATPADLLALGNLWMLRQDLLGYALLGDPAVRLPLAGRERRPVRDPDIEIDGEATERLDRLERGALEIARGESPGVVAAELGVPRSELEEAARAYRDAGRAALLALLTDRRDDDQGETS